MRCSDDLAALIQKRTESAPAGAESPAGTDGISFLPLLTGREQKEKHDYLYWELATDKGFQEIRLGSWKADILNVSQPGTPKLELYDLKTDPGEKNDVAAEHPDIVKRMREIAKAARTSNAMFPLTYEECRKAVPRGLTPKAKARK